MPVLARQAGGRMSARDGAAFDVLGAGAAVGGLIAVLALAATIAVLRGRPGEGLATTAWVLGWLRLVAIPVTAVVIGLGAVTGLVETFIIGLALLDAIMGLILAGTVRRLTRPLQQPLIRR